MRLRFNMKRVTRSQRSKRRKTRKQRNVSWKPRSQASKRAKKQGREEGLKEGVEKGIKNAHARMVRQLMVRGTDVHLIAEITGLSLEQIEAYIIAKLPATAPDVVDTA